MYWEQNKTDLTSILVTLIFPTCLLRSFGTTNRHLVQTLFFRLIRIAIFYWHYCPKCEGAISSTETGDTSFDSPRVQSEYLPSKTSAWSVSFFFWIEDSWRFWNNKYGAIMNQRDEGLKMMRNLIFQHYWRQLNWSLSNVAFFEIFGDIDCKNILQCW